MSTKSLVVVIDRRDGATTLIVQPPTVQGESPVCERFDVSERRADDQSPVLVRVGDLTRVEDGRLYWTPRREGTEIELVMPSDTHG